MVQGIRGRRDSAEEVRRGLVDLNCRVAWDIRVWRHAWRVAHVTFYGSQASPARRTHAVSAMFMLVVTLCWPTPGMPQL